MTLLKTQQLILNVPHSQTTYHVNLAINSGEMWAVLGKNGAGKTTLLRHLAGLNKTSQTHIYYNKQPVSQLSAKAIARHIALLTQETSMPFPQTVWQYCINARFCYRRYFSNATHHDKTIVDTTLSDLALLPLKNRRVDELSGGEMRRVALAAVCIQTPSVYLLDEPTNHLDPDQQSLIMHYFKVKTTQSTACIMTMHDINLVQQYCDHIILLNPDGHLLIGKTEAILTESNLSELYKHPFRRIQNEKNIYWHLQANQTHAIPIAR